MQEIARRKPLIHLFVCVNDRSTNTCPMPSCGPTITKKHVKEVKQWILQNGWVHTIYCTKTLCLGLCHKEGGVAVIYPSGRFFKEIADEEDLKKIILSEMKTLTENQ